MRTFGAPPRGSRPPRTPKLTQKSSTSISPQLDLSPVSDSSSKSHATAAAPEDDPFALSSPTDHKATARSSRPINDENHPPNGSSLLLKPSKSSGVSKQRKSLGSTTTSSSSSSSSSSKRAEEEKFSYTEAIKHRKAHDEVIDINANKVIVNHLVDIFHDQDDSLEDVLAWDLNEPMPAAAASQSASQGSQQSSSRRKIKQQPKVQVDEEGYVISTLSEEQEKDMMDTHKKLHEKTRAALAKLNASKPAPQPTRTPLAGQKRKRTSGGAAAAEAAKASLDPFDIFADDDGGAVPATPTTLSLSGASSASALTASATRISPTSRDYHNDDFFRDDMLEDVFDLGFGSPAESQQTQRSAKRRRSSSEKSPMPAPSTPATTTQQQVKLMPWSPNNKPTADPRTPSAATVSARLQKLQQSASKLKTTTPPSASLLKQQSKEQVMKEDIIFLLDSLQQDAVGASTLEIKVANLKKLASYLVTGSQADLCTFLRAHELVKSFIDVLSKVYAAASANDADDETCVPLMRVLVAHLLSTLLNDILNAEFASEETIRTLLNFIANHHPDSAGGNGASGAGSASTSPLLATPPVRAIRARKGKASPAVLSKHQQEANAMRRTASSLAFRALKTVCTVSEQAKSWFKSNGGEATLARLIPAMSIAAAAATEGDQGHAADIVQLIRLLMLTEYDFRENWNMVLPSLISLVDSLAPVVGNRKMLLCELADDHSPRVECTLACLQLLCNITNLNKHVAQMLVAERGLELTVRVLASNNNRHFDIINICLALLANLTEHDDANRRALRSCDMSSLAMPTSKRFFDYLVEYFVDNYDDSKSTGENVSGAYAAILLGCLARNDKNRTMLRERLPHKSFDDVVVALTRFLKFQSHAQMLTDYMFTTITSMIKELTGSGEASAAAVAAPIGARAQGETSAAAAAAIDVTEKSES